MMKMFCGGILVLLVAIAAGEFQFKHHDNNELTQVLEDIHQRCPNITRVYTLSETSVRGVPLSVIEFSSWPGHHQTCKLYIIIINVGHNINLYSPEMSQNH